MEGTACSLQCVNQYNAALRLILLFICSDQRDFQSGIKRTRAAAETERLNIQFIVVTEAETVTMQRFSTNIGIILIWHVHGGRRNNTGRKFQIHNFATSACTNVFEIFPTRPCHLPSLLYSKVS